VPPPRYFVVGSPVFEDAWQLLRAHSDVGDDKIEAAGPASIPNKLAFEINVGEVKQSIRPIHDPAGREVVAMSCLVREAFEAERVIRVRLRGSFN
jgi:hypothetical protein